MKKFVNTTAVAALVLLCAACKPDNQTNGGTGFIVIVNKTSSDRILAFAASKEVWEANRNPIQNEANDGFNTCLRDNQDYNGVWYKTIHVNNAGATWEFPAGAMVVYNVIQFKDGQWREIDRDNPHSEIISSGNTRTLEIYDNTLHNH
ncbi:MAG: hypothetical protein LBD29_11440 [Treponema sp.]|nr:hypothetical protein [Treponema sp.]